MGVEVVVIDYDFLWSSKSGIGFQKTRKEMVPGKVFPDIKIRVITPWMIKLPLFNRLSIIPSHTINIIKTIKQFQPDVLINFGILNASLSTLIAKLYKIPSTYYIIDHLHLLLENPLLERIAKAFEIFNIRHSKALFAINQGLLDYSNRLTRTKFQREVLIKGGVDFHLYDSYKDEKYNMRQKYGIPPSATVLFFMGWLYKFSRLDELAEKIVKAHPLNNLYLFVVGDGDLLAQLTQIKLDSVNGDKIILTGKVEFEEIPRLICLSDFCLLPSKRNQIMENIVPIKLYEYLASSKPVICTYLPGVYKEFGDDSGIIYINNIEEIFQILEKNVNSSKSEMQARATGLKSDWSMRVEQFQNELKLIIDEEKNGN